MTLQWRILCFASLITVGFSQEKADIWPDGEWAFLTTKEGCPRDDDYVKWSTGLFDHGTQFPGNHNNVSFSSHFREGIFRNGSGSIYVTLNYCCTKPGIKDADRPEWPKGSYCIVKDGFKCPEGFRMGYVYYAVDDTTRQAAEGHVPDRLVEKSHVRFSYCCRNDGKASTAIDLPMNTAFYLFRRGGTCQEVYGMQETAEWILLDEINSVSFKKPIGIYPDVDMFPDIRHHLCFYSVLYARPWRREATISSESQLSL